MVHDLNEDEGGIDAPVRSERRRNGSSRWKWALLFGLVAASAAIVVFAQRISPWSGARTLPLVFHLTAPADAGMVLRFGPDDREAVPLVPASIPADAGGAVDLWLAEAPPLASYDLDLEFRTGPGRVEFRGLVAMSAPGRGAPMLAWTAQELEFGKGLGDAAASVNAEAGLSLPLVRGRSFPPEWTAGGIVLGLLGVLLAAALVLLALWRAFRRPPPAIPKSPAGRGGLILIAAVLALLVHLLAASSIPVLVLEDSYTYLYKAVKLAELGTFSTGGQEGEITRLPGYPAFLSWLILLSGHNLRTVATLQGILFVLGLLALANALRRFVPEGLLAIAVLAGAASRAQLCYQRAILSEGPFVSLCLFALAAVVGSIGRSGPRLVLMSVVMGVLGAAMILTRSVGIVFLAVILVRFIPDLVSALRGHRTRTRPRLACATMAFFALVVPLGMTWYADLLWAGRNQDLHGYDRSTAMVGISTLQGPLFTGTFDPRAALDAGQYETYVRGRYETGYQWHAWHLDKVFHDAAKAEGIAHPIAEVEARHLRLAALSRSMLPWEMRVVAHIRSLLYTVLKPDGRDFAGRDLRWNYAAVAHASAAVDVATAEAVLLERTGRAFKVDHPTNGVLAQVADGASALYHAISFWVLAAAIAGTVILLFLGHHGLSAPFAFVFANVAGLGLLLHHSSRYTDLLDVLVLFQAVTGLGVGATTGFEHLLAAWRARARAPRRPPEPARAVVRRAPARVGSAAS